jgi:hypothetical protein
MLQSVALFVEQTCAVIFSAGDVWTSVTAIVPGAAAKICESPEQVPGPLDRAVPLNVSVVWTGVGADGDVLLQPAALTITRTRLRSVKSRLMTRPDYTGNRTCGCRILANHSFAE